MYQDPYSRLTVKCMPPKARNAIDEITRDLERVNRLQARPDLAKRAYAETELTEAQVRIGDRQNVSPWDFAKMGHRLVSRGSLAGALPKPIAALELAGKMVLYRLLLRRRLQV